MAQSALRSPLRPAIRSALRSPLEPAFSSGGDPIPDYYVSNSGSDSNAGTSAAPFLTLSKALSVFTTGKVIGLQYGDTWHESLDFGFSFANAAVVAYGTPGALPIIDCSDPVTAGTWTLSVDPGAAGNVYEISRTALVGTSAQHQQVFQNSGGVYLTRATSVANCQATPGSYYVTDVFTAAVAYKIYLHPVGSTSPITNGISYSVAERLVAIASSTTGGTLTVNNIDTRRNLAHNGSIVQQNGTFTGSGFLAKDGQIHNVYIENGTLKNADINNCEQGFNFVGYASASGQSITLDGCRFGSPSTPTPNCAMFFHGNNRGMSRRIKDVTVDRYERAVSIADFDGTLIMDGAIAECTNGTGRVIDLTDTNGATTGGDAFIIGGKAIGNCLYFSQVVSNATRIFLWEPTALILANIFTLNQTTEIHVIGGAFVDRLGYGSNFVDGAGRANVVVKHCLWDIVPNSVFAAIISASGSYAFDKNVYWSRGGTDLRWVSGGVQKFGLASWQTTGQDANSVFADPLWVSDPNAVTNPALLNFSVTGASPAITVGAGPGRVPLDYVFPSWVPTAVRILCGRS